MQHLERDRPVVPKVAGQIDRGHAAPAKLAHDRIALLERVAERGNRQLTAVVR